MAKAIAPLSVIESAMKLKVKMLHPDAVMPKYATAGAACFDLHAILDDGCELSGIYPAFPNTFRTGLSFEVPEGHVMLIFSRSGHGFKNDARLANCVGVIDSDYRGEVSVKMTSDRQFSDAHALVVRNGDRIAQAMIIPFPKIEFEEVDKLGSTERGTGGFGSTGS